MTVDNLDEVSKEEVLEPTVAQLIVRPAVVGTVDKEMAVRDVPRMPIPLENREME